MKLLDLCRSQVAVVVALLALTGTTPRPSVADSPALSPAQVATVVTAAEKALEGYVFPSVGARAIGRLRARLPDYQKLTGQTELVAAMNADLAEVTHDKHVRVYYPNEAPGRSSGPPTAEDIRAAHLEELSRNEGFRTVRRYAGNVGYIDLRGFSPDESVGSTIAAAMNFVANTNALIIDLRKNGGGDATAAETLEAYFFPTQQQITSLMWRGPDGKVSEIQQYTDAHVAGELYLERPVYLLTSSRTFSCAEQFAYDLRNLKRVTIVGETTGGGANPGGLNWLGEGFSLFVPLGRAYSNVTQTNWEGVGVKPDVASTATEALQTAYTLALEAVKTHPHDRHLDDELAGALHDPGAALTP
jgi:hypothetical protein